LICCSGTDTDSAIKEASEAQRAVLTELLSGLPVRVVPMSLKVSPDATEDEQKRIGYLLQKFGQNSTVETNFLKGEWFNGLPAGYGEKKRLVEEIFGKDTPCYKDYTNCAWVTSKWPVEKRKAGYAWNFYKNQFPNGYKPSPKAPYSANPKDTLRTSKGRTNSFPKGKDTLLTIDNTSAESVQGDREHTLRWESIPDEWADDGLESVDAEIVSVDLNNSRLLVDVKDLQVIVPFHYLYELGGHFHKAQESGDPERYFRDLAHQHQATRQSMSRGEH
jgi:hypothetical protein